MSKSHASSFSTRHTRRQHQQPTKTSSQCVAEGDTVTHDFEVACYSQLIKTLGVGQFVTSRTFSAGGHDWAIKLYPKQHGAASTTARPLTARFTLCLLRKDGRVSPMATEAMTASFGAPPRDRHGFHKLLPNAASSGRGGASTTTWSPSGMGADVTLDVGGRAFPAHRVVLAARSPVFRAELFGGMMEKDAQRIKIAGVRPEVFGLLLRFMYTESLPGEGEGCDAATMRRLLVAADLYGLDRLKHICEGKLHASIDERTVASMLALAERHNCPRLRDACLAFTSSSLSS
ncbi:unnamed protein product [Urochloa decumbens]|uniref:BTB domain-containing protein n=1 Tax=Urochloa decumbens TaxID=240449 RepID=A0ABC8XNX4_9POAL